MKIFFLLALIVALASADIYMHSPKGSNNRLNEANTNRNNANRLFDSQNNGKGGYCWAPTPTYYSGSFLLVEWTNQHGCGSSHANVDCDIIMQYMCGKDVRDGSGYDPNDGDNQNTDRIPFFEEENQGRSADDLDPNGEYIYGMHESEEYFRRCHRRRRNKGVFYADQNNPDSDQKSARYTRQGNDDNRHGFECPEERDYYPYWHPSPWKDIAIYTSNYDRCSHFIEHSQNSAYKWWCLSSEDPEEALIDSELVEYHETEEKCDKGNGQWVGERWNIKDPECYPAGWNRDNHLGNGAGGHSNTYKWVLPDYSVVKGDEIEIVTDEDPENPIMVVPCVFRIRYNISSGDFVQGVENTGLSPETFPPSFADHTMNGDESPVKQDPYIAFGKPIDEEDHQEWHIKLAIDTSQFARTFQERSHMFYIRDRGAITGNIFNILVRGKRGNIVQTYPAVEYDFSPNDLKMKAGEYIHFQVTGCDNNPAGNDGEGTDSTDRSNMVQIGSGEFLNGRGNYPVAYEETSMWGTPNTPLALERTWAMAFIGQYNGKQCRSQDELNCCLTLEQLMAKYPNANDRDEAEQNCAILNAPGANGFDSGLIQMTEGGTFHYMSSRNNNFTNRSQKAQLTVTGVFSTFTIVVLGGGVGAFAVAAVVAGCSWSGNGAVASVAV